MALQIKGNLPSNSLMRPIGGALLLVVLAVLILGNVFGTISTGNVGVQTTLGVMSQEEVGAGG